MSQIAANQSQIDSAHPPDTEASSLSRESTQPRAIGRAVYWVLGTFPTLVVLVALGGIAFWGHQTGWQVPKFSALTGAATGEPEEWCATHNVPESECIECLPTLLPTDTDYGWCKGHGVHQCPWCHPDVAQLKSLATIDPAQLEAAALALTVLERQENNSGCVLYRSRVQFASDDAVKKAGIDFELVETQAITESIEANGEITYDETRVAHLGPRVPGTIWRVDRRVGDRVQPGDVLALIDSADVGNAKSELLDALAQVDFHVKTVARLQPLFEKQVITGSRMLEAETALQQAEIRLRRAEYALVNLGLPVSMESIRQLSEAERAGYVQFLGIPDDVRAELLPSTTSNNLIPLVASLEGVVIHREAVSGEVVSPSQLLFQIVDTSRMWLRFNIALEDASHLATGQAVVFHPDGSRHEVRGELSWISTDVDKETRTVEIRAEVDNSDGRLRNETFGLGHVVLRESADSVVVPSLSVQWDGSCFVVFVRDKDYFAEGHPKLFHTRTVRPGVAVDGRTEIIAGLLPGEVVVTNGSSVLRSQILKNSLGAGCTCGH